MSDPKPQRIRHEPLTKPQAKWLMKFMEALEAQWEVPHDTWVMQALTGLWWRGLIDLAPDRSRKMWLARLTDAGIAYIDQYPKEFENVEA